MCYTDSDRYNDFKWFVSKYNELYSKYGQKVFAIRNKQILGIFDDENIAIDTISNEYPIGSFIVQKCNGNESGYTNYVTSWELIK